MQKLLNNFFLFSLEIITNELIVGYVSNFVGCCIECRYHCFVTESWYMYCVASIRIHSRHTNVSTPSKLNIQ